MKKNIFLRFAILTFGVFLSFILFQSCKSGKTNKVQFGIITDVHQDLQKNAVERLQEFITKAQTKADLDFIIQLGDLSHGKTIDTIINVWNTYQGQSYHVLGNHDTDYSTKEVLIEKQNMSSNYYSFDNGDVHFVVLDLNYIFKEDKFLNYDMGNNWGLPAEHIDLINPEQLEWLKKDLKKTDKPTIIFSHQALDDVWMYPQDVCPNRAEVRKIIDEANSRKESKVIAAFCGHHHLDAYSEINGVHYFQMNSASYYWISENSGYSRGNMAEYKDALYAFITIDLDRRTIEIEGIKSEFIPPAPTTADYENADSLFPEIKSRIVKF